MPSNKLTKKDYTGILEYYKQPLPKSYNTLKTRAKKIITRKLCKCIKKIDAKQESKSIGICTKSIFNKKGYTRGKFKCGKKSMVDFRKTIKNKNKK